MSWPTKKLSDLAESEKGSFVDGPFGSNLKASEYQDSGVPIIRLQNVKPNYFLPKDIKYISREKADQLERHSFTSGDLVIAKLGDPCAVACLIPEGFPDGRIVADVVRFRGDRDRVNHKYVAYFLNAPAAKRQIDAGTTGTTRKRVNLSKLKSLQIPLPPLEEQKRIAAILDAADDLRAKRREAIQQLDELLQATFLDLFGDPVTNPKGWEVAGLGSICDVRDGTHDSPKYVEAGHPLLTSKNFKDGQINYSGANLITNDDFQQINKRSKVDVGDLVMPMIGTIGNPVLVEKEPDFAIKNVALIKFSDESPNNKFIRALLCSHYFDHVTSKANRGGTQKFVALKDLRGMPIPMPPANLQQQFADTVSAVEEQKARYRAHLDELDTLFASLQSRAFQGEL